MNFKVIPCLVAGGLLLALGCGPDTSHLPATVPASGVVTLDGKPVDGAQVVLIPQPPATKGAYAATDASGKFSLRAFEEKDGAIPGDYKVQVSKTIQVKIPGVELDGGEAVRFEFGVPEKYTSVATSGLTCKIPEGGTSDIKLELISK